MDDDEALAWRMHAELNSISRNRPRRQATKAGDNPPVQRSAEEREPSKVNKDSAGRAKFDDSDDDGISIDEGSSSSTEDDDTEDAEEPRVSDAKGAFKPAQVPRATAPATASTLKTGAQQVSTKQPGSAKADSAEETCLTPRKRKLSETALNDGSKTSKISQLDGEAARKASSDAAGTVRPASQPGRPPLPALAKERQSAFAAPTKKLKSEHPSSHEKKPKPQDPMQSERKGKPEQHAAVADPKRQRPDQRGANDKKSKLDHDSPHVKKARTIGERDAPSGAGGKLKPDAEGAKPRAKLADASAVLTKQHSESAVGSGSNLQPTSSKTASDERPKPLAKQKEQHHPANKSGHLKGDLQDAAKRKQSAMVDAQTTATQHMHARGNTSASSLPLPGSQADPPLSAARASSPHRTGSGLPAFPAKGGPIASVKVEQDAKNMFAMPQLANAPPGPIANDPGAEQAHPAGRVSMRGGQGTAVEAAAPATGLQGASSLEVDEMEIAKGAAAMVLNVKKRYADAENMVKCFFCGQRYGIWLACDRISTRKLLAEALNEAYTGSIISCGKGERLYVIFIDSDGMLHEFPMLKGKNARPEVEATWESVSRRAVRVVVRHQPKSLANGLA